MEQKMLRGTQRQLRGLADGLAAAGSEQAAVLMAQTGASLMANCAGLCSALLTGMSDNDFTDIADACGMMARKTSELLEHPRFAPVIDQLQQLESLRRMAEAGRCELNRLNGEMEAAREENRRISSETEAIRSRMVEAGDETLRLLGQRGELERQWNEMDAQLKLNAEKVFALEKQLSRLRSEDFGPDRQEKLRGEIDALTEQTDRDRAAVETLGETLGQLRDAQTALSEQRDALEGGALEIIRTALSRMDAASSRRCGELEEVRKTVDTLTERFDRCRSLQTDYESWLDANGATMDELARILGENDPLHGSLRKTLDPAQTARLRRLQQSAEDSLSQMDALLTPCIRLMSCSRRDVLSKITQGPGGTVK